MNFRLLRLALTAASSSVAGMYAIAHQIVVETHGGTLKLDS